MLRQLIVKVSVLGYFPLYIFINYHHLPITFLDICDLYKYNNDNKIV